MVMHRERVAGRRYGPVCGGSVPAGTPGSMGGTSGLGGRGVRPKTRAGEVTPQIARPDVGAIREVAAVSGAVRPADTGHVRPRVDRTGRRVAAHRPANRVRDRRRRERIQVAEELMTRVSPRTGHRPLRLRVPGSPQHRPRSRGTPRHGVQDGSHRGFWPTGARGPAAVGPGRSSSCCSPRLPRRATGAASGHTPSPHRSTKARSPGATSRERNMPMPAEPVA